MTKSVTCLLLLLVLVVRLTDCCIDSCELAPSRAAKASSDEIRPAHVRTLVSSIIFLMLAFVDIFWLVKNPHCLFIDADLCVCLFVCLSV